ncbi:MAG: hypothetical protein NVS2B2_22210 [Ktedonobacteraceae bacterium]
MSISLEQRMIQHIQDVFQKTPDAWLVWCDPNGSWLPLLLRVFRNDALNGVRLIQETENTAHEFGSPGKRREVQHLLDAHAHFVLYVKTSKEQLGWLWSQALLAEAIYTESLRSQLLDWGWKPQSILTSDEVVAQLARQHIQDDPSEWSSAKIQLQPQHLLAILAGGTVLPRDHENDHESGSDGAGSDLTVLNLTIEEAGLPKLEPSTHENGRLAFAEQDVERWRIRCVAHLLVTQAHTLAPDYIRNHEYLISAEKRTFALHLLNSWLDSLKLRRGLPPRVLEADRLLSLGNFLGGANIQYGPFLSQSAEKALFAALCQRLMQQQGRALLENLVPLRDDLLRHAHDFWGDNAERAQAQAVPWGELARLSEAVTTLLDATPRVAWAKPADAVNWYIHSGWRVEQAGEQILQNLSKTSKELLDLITPLREAYRNHWEHLMIEWSDVWSNAKCPLLEQKSQGEWLRDELKASASPTAILVIDALRYDIGMALQQQVNTNEGMDRARVVAARTALPTITALGMGMALPLAESELQAEIVRGKWQLYQKGQTLDLSIAENRREWLKIHYKVAPEALLQLADVRASGSVPTPQGKRPLLFLFDALLDKLGHDEELEGWGTKAIQDNYINVIERLRDTGWERILIVTDHGFISWPGSIEHRVTPLPDAAYSSRRAMAYPAETQLAGPQGLAPGGKWRIAVPHGAECFRTYGGLGFFHGGASLQEWIVPCLKIAWPAKARPVTVVMQRLDKLLSLRQRIVLEVQNEGLFSDNNVLSRQVEVVVSDVKQQIQLFQGKTKLIKPEDGSVAIILEPLDDVEATRNTPLLIELRDARTREILDSQPSTLLVALENW